MTVPPTPDYSTQAETAEGMIRNALQMCDSWATLGIYDPFRDGLAVSNAFAGVARLLRAALSKLDGREAAHPQGDQ